MSAISGLGGGSGGQSGGIRQIMEMRQQIIDRNTLLQQLHSTQGTQETAATTASTGSSDGAASGFGDTLKSALEGVSQVQSKSEDISAAYERGEVTDVAKVMLARQEAGVAFEATLQVRNKLLSAYQDIMRMGV